MRRLDEDVDMDQSENDDEEYDENADDDFNPDKVPAEDHSTSDEEEDAQTLGKHRKAKKRKSEEAAEELDSGDEATIKERERKRRKAETEDDDADDSAGERGFIRTRAQRQADKIEQKQRRKATSGVVTIDVDEVWAKLISQPVGRASAPVPDPDVGAAEVDQEQNKEEMPAGVPPIQDLITIKRRIQYAGEITEVEEQVPRNSREAQKYLAEHPEADPKHKLHDVDVMGIQRPLKRYSIFEPNPTSLVKGVAPEKLRPKAPSRLDVQRIEDEKKKKALKMSTVQKSALDWRGFVDKEGIREELDEYGKSKKGFMAREAFLDRAAGAREQAARDARLKI